MLNLVSVFEHSAKEVPGKKENTLGPATLCGGGGVDMA